MRCPALSADSHAPEPRFDKVPIRWYFDFMSLVKCVLDRDLPDGFSMLEIGVGSYPFSPESTVLISNWCDPNLYFDFTGNRSYLGVDNGTAVGDYSYLGTPEKIAAEAMWRLAEHKERVQEFRPGQNADFRFQDAFELAGSPERFDEVMMSNVLSSMIGNEGARALLQLSYDVLVDSGMLVTRETFTPQFMEEEEVTELVKEIGFDEFDVVSHRLLPYEYDALSDYYGPTIFDEKISRPHSGRYFCLATK